MPIICIILLNLTFLLSLSSSTATENNEIEGSIVRENIYITKFQLYIPSELQQKERESFLIPPQHTSPQNSRWGWWKTGAAIGVSGALSCGAAYLGAPILLSLLPVGATMGGCLGSYYGQYSYRDLKIQWNGDDWLKSSLLDLVFQSTKNNAILWEARLQLRPNVDAWRIQDPHASYLSCVRMDYYTEETSEQEQELIKALVNRRLYLSGQQSSDHLFPTKNTVSSFEGTLPRACSLQALIIILNSMGNESERLPYYTCAGITHHDDYSSEKEGFNEGVINSAIFSCRVLKELGLSFSGTSLNNLLAPYYLPKFVTGESVIAALNP